MSKTNFKQVSRIKEIMWYKLKQLDRNIKLVFADSEEYDKAKNNYLPGELMNYMRGKIINLFDQVKTKINI